MTTNNIITETEQNETIERILASQEFKNSPKNQDLLKYLFNAYKEGEEKKEITIALEFFRKSTDFDPTSDSSVRVYISKLRKKIEYFNKTAGLVEKIKLQIPKGHYNLLFVHSDSITPLVKKNRTLIPILLSTIVLLLITTIFLSNEYFSSSPKIENHFSNNPVWAEFVNSSKSTILVLGDYYFLYKFDDKVENRLFIRNTKINSLNDLNNYVEKYTEEKNKLFPLEFTYLRPSCSFSLLHILPIFNSSSVKMIPKLASELTWSDIENSNLIYIGPFKNMNILDKLLEKLNLSFQSNLFSEGHSTLYLNDDDGNVLSEFEPTSKSQEESYLDFGVLAKFKGSKDNTIMFILGFDELAIMAAVKVITDPNFDTIRSNDSDKTEIQQPYYFNMIFEAEGFRRTNLSYKVKYFKRL